LFFLVLGLIMLIPLLLFTGRFKRHAEPGPIETTRQTSGL
jgi:hypothetical protein